MDDNTEQPARRARIRRPGAFAGGFSRSAETLRAADERHDDDEDLVETPEDRRAASAELDARVSRLPPPVAPAPAAGDWHPTDQYGHDIPGDPGPAGRNPASQINEVSMAGSAAYTKEYRLGVLHRLLSRGFPLTNCAQAMGVSLSTAEKDRAELRKRLRQTAATLNVEELVGDQMARYRDISAQALRIATQESTTVPMKLAAMRTSLHAEADFARFLNVAGVFDAKPFQAALETSAQSDVQMLIEATNRALLQLTDDDAAPASRGPRRVSRSRRAGFEDMDFSQTQGDSSQELVDL